MKKLLLVLIMLALVLPAFADDAKVLPKGVLRTYLAPSYTTITEVYDADGEATDVGVAETKLLNLGAALEYGITDWVNLGLQWGPGVNVYWDVDGNDDVQLNVPSELFVGSKVQIVGPQAPVMNDQFRVAASLGALVPMAFGYDAEDESTNMMSGKEYKNPTSTNATAIGARFHADYVVNKMFFMNIYSEYQYRFPVKKEKAALSDYGAALGAAEDEIDYGYKLTLEAEPHFAYMVADGVEMSAGLPITYVATPETKIGDNGLDNASKKLTLAPSVSAFLTSIPLPLEFKLGYSFPVMGENTNKANTLVFQLKAYMKF